MNKYHCIRILSKSSKLCVDLLVCIIYSNILLLKCSVSLKHFIHAKKNTDFTKVRLPLCAQLFLKILQGQSVSIWGYLARSKLYLKNSSSKLQIAHALHKNKYLFIGIAQ